MKWRSLEESTDGVETRSLAEVFAERKELIAKYVPARSDLRSKVGRQFGLNLSARYINRKFMSALL